MDEWLPSEDDGSDRGDQSYELSNSFDMDAWLASGQATDEDLMEEEPEAPPVAAGDAGSGEAAAGGFLASGSTTGVGDRVQDAPLMPILVVVAAVLVIGLLAVAGPWVDGYNVIGLDSPGGDGDGTGPANGTATATPTDNGTDTATETETETSAATDTDTSSPTSSPTATEASTPADTPTATEESTPAPTASPTDSPTETETPILPVETPGGDGTPTIPGGDETSTATETGTATPGPLDPILDPLPGLSLEFDGLIGSLF